MLAAAGILASLVLEVVHVRAYLDPTVSSFCAVGEGFDCDTVALSRYSVILGVPLPLWGVAGFTGMLAAAVRGSRLLLPLAGFATLASIALFVEELVDIHSICWLCSIVHLAAIALLVVAWRGRKQLSSPPTRQMALELGLPAAILLGSSLVVPPYWSLVSWKSGVRYAHGVDEEGRPWIGAENPTITVIEYVDYGCPHCAVATSKMRMLMADHADDIRLVRHHQPRMRCKLGLQCQYARAAICAGQQDKFWQMDDWLFRHAPGHESVDLAQAATDIGLDHAALMACIDLPETYAAADRDAKAARKAKVNETPAYAIEGEKLLPGEAHARIRERL
jgi:uncharacterized membrane protein